MPLGGYRGAASTHREPRLETHKWETGIKTAPSRHVVCVVVVWSQVKVCGRRLSLRPIYRLYARSV